MEEFQESEVLWPVDHHHQQQRMSFAERNFTKKSMDLMKQTQSHPVDIPENKMCKLRFDRLEFQNYEDKEQQKMVLPPHEMLAKRYNGERMAFSVCTGNGRTLKGRDLSKVRNSILRMTGFLESC